jgi:hypothetical protein
MVGNSSFFKYRDTTVFMFVEEIILRWLNIVSLDKRMIDWPSSNLEKINGDGGTLADINI